MGQVIKIHCDNCNIDKTLNLGSGMRDFGKEMIIGYCSACNKYGSFYRSYETGEFLETCECGKIPTVVLTQEMNFSKEKIHCAKCDNELKVEVIGLFD